MRAVFYGLGSDGTVSANKNSIKIIGEHTDLHAQGYFVYDSKKAGAMTVSHLRFGPTPIRSTYLIRQASFVACHQFELLERTDVLAVAAPGATFLLNSPYRPRRGLGPPAAGDQAAASSTSGSASSWSTATRVAKEAGLGQRINTVLQTCFFALADVLPDRRGDRGDQGRDRQDLRQARARPCSRATSPRSTPRSPPCTR